MPALRVTRSFTADLPDHPTGAIMVESICSATQRPLVRARDEGATDLF